MALQNRSRAPLFYRTAMPKLRYRYRSKRSARCERQITCDISVRLCGSTQTSPTDCAGRKRRGRRSKRRSSCFRFLVYRVLGKMLCERVRESKAAIRMFRKPDDGNRRTRTSNILINSYADAVGSIMKPVILVGGR